MYKLERKITSTGVWQEVMLSPFKTKEEIKNYHSKYSSYYPKGQRTYRITNLESGGQKVIREY